MPKQVSTWALPLVLLLAAPVAAAPTAEPDKAVRKQLDKRKIRYEVDADGDFKVTYDLGGGRSQLAFVRSTTVSYGKSKIREILSIGYRGPDQFPVAVANRMLEHNNETKLGAWAKQGNMAVFTTKIPADASDHELIDALELTVSLADELERELTGDTDEF